MPIVINQAGNDINAASSHVTFQFSLAMTKEEIETQRVIRVIIPSKIADKMSQQSRQIAGPRALVAIRDIIDSVN